MHNSTAQHSQKCHLRTTVQKYKRQSLCKIIAMPCSYLLSPCISATTSVAVAAVAGPRAAAAAVAAMFEVQSPTCSSSVLSGC
jgi:hypothetical protein